tara:strand:- start:783 stop:1244 length:462 start_codon:yes stop_codon:yes gene_type:complete
MDTVRCVIVGKTTVGKTTLLKRAAYDFGPVIPTIGVDNQLFEYKGVYFQCWDTSGIDKFKTVVGMFVHHAQLTVYMYDAGRPETLEIDNIPPGAIIVANVYNYEGKIAEGHVPVNAYDRTSVDALLDLMIEKAPRQQEIRKSGKVQRECCSCF